MIRIGVRDNGLSVWSITRNDNTADYIIDNCSWVLRDAITYTLKDEVLSVDEVIEYLVNELVDNEQLRISN